MYNLDDQNLDRLSKEAAENYKLPMGTPSWDAMQRRLDEELPEEKRRRRGLIVFFILLGLLAGGSFYWYSQQKQNTPGQPVIASGSEKATTPANTNSKKSNTAAGSNDEAVKPPAGKTAASSPVEKNAGTTATTQPAAEPVVTKQKTVLSDTRNIVSAQKADKVKTSSQSGTKITSDKPAIQKAKRQATVISPVDNNNSQRVVAKANNSSAKQKDKNNKKQVTPVTAQQTQPADDIVADKKVTADKEKEEKGNSDVVTQPTTQTPPVTAEKKDAANADSAAVAVNTKDAETEKKNAEKNKVKKNNPPSKKAISLAAIGGADFSTVKFKYGDNTGYNAGLLAGFHFNDHWSVHTGFVYTKKIYKLNGKDYNPPEHYFTRYVDLQTVSGYCQMWELPVIGRYTFNPGKSGGRFFASTGLSSYFMKGEHYMYNYKLNNNPNNMSREWNSTEDYNHWFSILHLAVGYEKPLSSRFSLMVEPYAKLPLAGVGFGSIKLSSFGVNFALQLKQPVGKK